jgi:release factor glutamine methyltransferase
MLRIKLALVDRRKYERVVLENVDGVPIVVLPDVFNPKLLRSGEFLVQQLHQNRELLPYGSRVLDLGCGSGVAGVAAARAGCDVLSVDINPAAIRCTRINALINNVSIDIRDGDLFAPVEHDRFDVVLFNPPYYRGVPRDLLDHAWRSPDVVDRFAVQLAERLIKESRGYALVVLSSDGERDSFLQLLRSAGLQHEIVAERDFVNEVMRLYRVQPC